MAREGGMQAVIIIGLSGAGKSTALNVFEDLNFFCVDGLPAALIGKLAAFYADQNPDKYRGLALGMDLRQGDFLERFDEAVIEMKTLGMVPVKIFIEAKSEVLVRRYSSTRRPHPLEATGLGLEQAIEKEMSLLEPIRQEAELVLDTSNYSIHDLRRKLQEKWAFFETPGSGLRVHIVTFGFKYGPPMDADLVMDLRFLPNPYFVNELRPMSGRDQPIVDYVLGQEPGSEFLRRYQDFLAYLLPLYAQEGRYRLTLAMGCTGGRHRSVSVAENIFSFLKKLGYSATLEHRHLELG